MAAGVGPSSTVARQTPVRKHVAGSDALSRNLHPTSRRIFFNPLETSSRVRAADPSPLVAARFCTHTPGGMILRVTIVGAWLLDATEFFFLFFLKKLQQPTVVVER